MSTDTQQQHLMNRFTLFKYHAVLAGDGEWLASSYC